MDNRTPQDEQSGTFESEPLFSRTPGRDVFGKLDSSIPEVRVPHEVRLAAEARAAELGLDLSAFLRENLYASLYGTRHVASLYEDRAKRVLGKAWHEGDPVALRVVDTMREPR